MVAQPYVFPTTFFLVSSSFFSYLIKVNVIIEICDAPHVLVRRGVYFNNRRGCLFAPTSTNKKRDPFLVAVYYYLLENTMERQLTKIARGRACVSHVRAFAGRIIMRMYTPGDFTGPKSRAKFRLSPLRTETTAETCGGVARISLGRASRDGGMFRSINRKPGAVPADLSEISRSAVSQVYEGYRCSAIRTRFAPNEDKCGSPTFHL